MTNSPDSGILSVVGVILAGGLSRRMAGADKALVELGDRPMIGHVIERLKPQARPLILNANGDPARFARFGLSVIADPFDAFIGPMAGILAGLRWARENGASRWIAIAPADTPFLPHDFVSRLLGGLRASAEIVVARSRGRIHPVAGIWSVSLADDLSCWLSRQENRAARAWIETRNAAIVDFDDERDFDPFFNVNTPGDLTVAERHARGDAS